MEECTNKDIGQLIHAYELGALSDEETDVFERHLIGCKYCLSKVEKFQPYAHEMLNEISVLKNVNRAEVSKAGLWEKIWPKGGMLFKPGILYILILILLIPAIWGFTLGFFNGSKLKPVQIVKLSEHITRSGEGEAFSLRSDYDGLIDIIYSFEADDKYAVIIKDSSGKERYSLDNFEAFDIEESTASVILPRSDMVTGRFQTFIKNLDTGAMDDLGWFNINP